MRAGNLTHRIKFYPKVSVRDAYNASVDSWPTATITTRGELRWVGGSHTLNNDEKFYSKSVELTVRYRPDIVETMRVQIDDEPYIYGISYLEVIGRNEGLRMSLEKLADNLPTETVDPPSNLMVTTISETSIGLTWVNNSDNDPVSIERSEDGMVYSVVDLATGVTEYTDEGLGATTRYFYRIRAYKDSAYSAYSNVDDSMTMPTGSYLVRWLWSGTQAEYDALGIYDNETVYVII